MVIWLKYFDQKNHTFLSKNISIHSDSNITQGGESGPKYVSMGQKCFNIPIFYTS